MATIVAVRQYLRQICHRKGRAADVAGVVLNLLQTLSMTRFPLRLAAYAVITVSALSAAGSLLYAQDVPPERVFAAVPFDKWVKQGPQAPMPWKVTIHSYGLTLYQRLLAHVDVELSGKDLVTRSRGDRIVAFIQVSDAAGHQFRDYSFFQVKEIPSKLKKFKADFPSDFFVLPGGYKLTVALYDAQTGQHNLMESSLQIAPLKDDPLPDAWRGLPEVEFLGPPLESPDNLFRPDITSTLHLPLATKRPIHMELLADVTASDLFRGSTLFYNRYLSVALPLLKSLDQIKLQNGSLSVAMLDLRKRRVTFEQDGGKALDWTRARAVLAPENGPGAIDIKALEQRRESPAFLQDELLRRLNAPARSPQKEEEPFHVFVIIGSPMDFYSFRNLPHMPPGSEEKCVVYYLQFELLNTTYANGAVNNVRNMLKPLTVHVIKVRSAESIRRALARILDEVSQM
jgi:hypothetical protein